MTCPTERAVAANLFFSFGTVDDNGEVTLQPHDLRRMLQSMGVVSLASPPVPLHHGGSVSMRPPSSLRTVFLHERAMIYGLFKVCLGGWTKSAQDDLTL